MARPPKHNLEEIVPEYNPAVFTAVHGRHGNYVLYTRNGKVFARKFVPPGNPRTSKQQRGRCRMKRLVERWKKMGAAEQGRWNDLAGSKRRKRGYAYFLSVNLKKAAAEADVVPVPSLRRRYVAARRPRAHVNIRRALKMRASHSLVSMVMRL